MDDEFDARPPLLEEPLWRPEVPCHLLLQL